MLRMLVILFAINLVLVGFILASHKSAKTKSIWSTILLMIPLLGVAIYYLIRNSNSARNPFKDWENR